MKMILKMIMIIKLIIIIRMIIIIKMIMIIKMKLLKNNQKELMTAVFLNIIVVKLII